MLLNKILAVLPKADTIAEQIAKLEQQEILKKAEEVRKALEKVKVDKLHGAMAPSVGQMYDASNTLKAPIFDTGNITFLDKAEHFFNATDKVINWITHPILIINGLAGASFYVAAAIGFTGLIFYIIGYKKGMKYVVGSVVGYTLIQIINWGANLL